MRTTARVGQRRWLTRRSIGVEVVDDDAGPVGLMAPHNRAPDASAPSGDQRDLLPGGPDEAVAVIIRGERRVPGRAAASRVLPTR
jgi:hypothetical protein